MGVPDRNYQVVYRGETLQRFVDGGWVFFQRRKEYGGGWWFGRSYNDCFWLEFERPCALREGLSYLVNMNSIANQSQFDDDFKLEG